MDCDIHSYPLELASTLAAPSHPVIGQNARIRTLNKAERMFQFFPLFHNP